MSYVAKGVDLSDKFQRDLLRGSLDLMVLSVLAGGKKYGYFIQKEVREASGGAGRFAGGHAVSAAAPAGG